MPNIGPLELIIVLIIAVLILGPKRIPAAARSVGEGIRGFRSSLKGGEEDRQVAAKDEAAGTGQSETTEKSKTGV